MKKNRAKFEREREREKKREKIVWLNWQVKYCQVLFVQLMGELNL